MEGAGDFDHERGHDDADGVADEERRENGGGDDGVEQRGARAGPPHRPLGDQREEPRQAKIGDDDHHSEQEQDRFVMDRSPRFVDREYPGAEHESRADDGGTGSIQSQPREAPDCHDRKGEGKNQDRRKLAWVGDSDRMAWFRGILMGK